MPEDPKPHQLYKQCPVVSFQINYATPGSSSIGYGSGWSINAANIGIWRGYIDLAGWSRQDLTTFLQGVDVQKATLPVKAATPGLTKMIRMLDIVTTRRLTDDELSTMLNIPGFIGSTVDLMEVVFGRRQSLIENATIPSSFVQVDNATWGSGNPTASDKLHWTRMIGFVSDAAVGGEAQLIPAANLVVQAMTAKEKDLVWMERLRRSYVLQEAV